MFWRVSTLAFVVAVAVGIVAAQSPRPIVLVAVFDGLRPDSITLEDTPTLARLRGEGVSYTSSHSSFPTVTRVNGSTLVTGVYSQRHGLVSNTLYVPAVDPVKPISTGEWRQLAKLGDVSGGRLLFTPTLGEMLQQRGLTFVAASSGSTGSAFVLNPVAPRGTGVLISGHFDPGKRVAFPDRVSDAILRRFGPVPDGEGAASVDWTERVLRDYVLPELKPDVLVTWLTEPDGPQHDHGVGSPEARAGIRNSDRNLGLMLDALQRQSQATGRPFNVIVTSDHGFAHHGRAVNITAALMRAGLKSSATSDDVVVVSNGQSVLLHVKGSDEARIRRVVEFLQTQDDVDVIFTRAARASSSAPGPRGTTAHHGLPVEGRVPGTFSLELAHAANDARGADIMFTLRWSSAANRFGAIGTQTIVSETREATLGGDAAGHGGLNPWTVRNTLILWGPAFARGRSLDTPAGIVDIAPTILSLLDIAPDHELDGRVMREALRTSGNPRTSGDVWHETLTVTAGRYSASLRVSGVGSRWYLDEGARTAAPATAAAGASR